MDRPAAGARIAALHPRPEFPRRQPDRSRHRRADPRRQPRRRRVGSPHDPRQPAPRERSGRQGDHRAPEPAAAIAADPDGACLRAALSRARLQARRLRRSGAGSVQRGAAARSAQRVRPAQPAEAARGTASVDRGLRHASASDVAVGCRDQAAEPGDPRVSRERDRRRGHAPERRSPRPPGASTPRSISIRGPCRRT